MKASKLERRFVALWRAAGGPALMREYRFDAQRRWRLDFAHVESFTGIEVQGGVFGKGRRCPACKQRRSLGHGTSTGLVRDYEKLNAAQAAGWTVFQLARPMVSRKSVKMIVEFIREKAGSTGGQM